MKLSPDHSKQFWDKRLWILYQKLFSNCIFQAKTKCLFIHRWSQKTGSICNFFKYVLYGHCSWEYKLFGIKILSHITTFSLCFLSNPMVQQIQHCSRIGLNPSRVTCLFFHRTRGGKVLTEYTVLTHIGE